MNENYSVQNLFKICFTLLENFTIRTSPSPWKKIAEIAFYHKEVKNQRDPMNHSFCSTRILGSSFKFSFLIKLHVQKHSHLCNFVALRRWTKQFKSFIMKYYITQINPFMTEAVINGLVST